MAVIAEFDLDSQTFRMGRAFAGLDGARLRLDRIVPLSTAVIPYVWVRGVDPEAVLQTVGANEAVRQIREIDSLPEHGHLFHVEWDAAVEDAITVLSELDLVLLSGSGDETAWRLEFRADRRDAVTAFRRFCTERGIEVDLVRLTELRETDASTRYGLTPKQFETLVLAFERGYFDDSRRAELQDVADVLGVSRQSVAGRLRRGHRNLIEGALIRNHDATVDDRRSGGDER